MLKPCTLLLVFLSLIFKGYCQESLAWPSPEVQQMYKQAKEYLSRGAVQQSVVVLRQAVQLAPEIMILHRDLAQALNLSRSFKEAYQTVIPIIRNGKADAQTYQIAAVALQGAGDKKQAKALLERGIRTYPQSGILYNELARLHESSNDAENALLALLTGIEKDPAYHLNYYDAARTYSISTKPVWTIVYGEIFVNLERNTPRSLDLRKLIFQAYQKLFTTVSTSGIPKYGSTATASGAISFEKALEQTLMQLSPVVSDGITAENLTMLRTRFVMDWMFNGFMEQYPFSLFTYHDRMIRDGEFEAYNQWLFGRAENEALYETWTKFHKEGIPDLESWVKSNKFTPSPADFHNSKEFRNIFPKKKKN